MTELQEVAAVIHAARVCKCDLNREKALALATIELSGGATPAVIHGVADALMELNTGKDCHDCPTSA